VHVSFFKLIIMKNSSVRIIPIILVSAGNKNKTSKAKKAKVYSSKYHYSIFYFSVLSSQRSVGSSSA